MKEELLRLEHIYIRRSGKYVLSDFQLNIFRGEFLFVYGFLDSGIQELGEFLSGRQEAERGRIFVNESELPSHRFFCPEQHGVYIVQNENNLVPDFTIAENLFFGGGKKLFDVVVSRKKQEMMAQRLMREFGLDFDVSMPAGNLNYYEQIMVKFVMAYARGAKMVVCNGIIGFSVDEKENLEKIIRVLKEDGIAVLWLNQRMDEARVQSDRILMLRAGKSIGTVFHGYEELLDEVLTEQPTGRLLEAAGQPAECVPGAGEQTEFLRMKDICSPHLEHVSLALPRGRMIGIASDEPYSLAEFRGILCGEMHNYQGEIFFEEKPYRPKTIQDAAQLGVQYLDMMWYERHCIPNMGVVDNLLMGTYWKLKDRYGIVNESWREATALRYRMQHPDWPADKWYKLSTDQQKILLYEKAALHPCRLLVITEPFFQVNAELVPQIITLIQDIFEKNITIILTASNRSDLKKICERCYTIREKKLLP